MDFLEKESLENAYRLQIQKTANIRNAWVIETDPSRKFQYEQQLQVEERILKELEEKLHTIERQLQDTKNLTLENLTLDTNKNIPFQLNSERGIDYTKLQNYLKSGNLKEADKETFEVMNKVLKGNWRDDRNLKTFPSTDILTIDRLWLMYSNGRFGFSVQKKIYLEVGGMLEEYIPEAWRKFSERVNWRVNNKWINYDQITFNTSAIEGHLPAWMGEKSFWPDNVLSLLSHPELQLQGNDFPQNQQGQPQKQQKPKYEQEIFISYAWAGDSETYVNRLDTVLQSKGITIIRDKRDLGYKGLIKTFMEKIGRGKCVIAVISDKYLKSSNCMFELVQIAKNGNFYDRIFPILLEDAQIYNPIQRIKYIKHWEDQIKELDEAMKSVSAANLQGFREEIDLYTEIRNTIAELTNLLKNMNTLTSDIHSDSEFEKLLQAITQRLDE